MHNISNNDDISNQNLKTSTNTIHLRYQHDISDTNSQIPIYSCTANSPSNVCSQHSISSNNALFNQILQQPSTSNNKTLNYSYEQDFFDNCETSNPNSKQTTQLTNRNTTKKGPSTSKSIQKLYIEHTIKNNKDMTSTMFKNSSTNNETIKLNYPHHINNDNSDTSTYSITQSTHVNSESISNLESENITEMNIPFNQIFQTNF